MKQRTKVVKCHGKTNLKHIVLPLIDHVICCLIERLEPMHTVGAFFDILYNEENLLRE